MEIINRITKKKGDAALSTYSDTFREKGTVKARAARVSGKSSWMEGNNKLFSEGWGWFPQSETEGYQNSGCLGCEGLGMSG